MLVVKLVSLRNELVVPALIASLAAANQQYGHSARIECIQYAVGFSLMLNSQLAHVAVL